MIRDSIPINSRTDCVFPTGGMSWWITVTPPPLGTLMMRYAMTFSLGNLVFSEIMCALTRWVLITCSTDYTMHKGHLEEMICTCECVCPFVWVWLQIVTLSSHFMIKEALFLVMGAYIGATRIHRQLFLRMEKVKWAALHLKCFVLWNIRTRRCRLSFCIVSQSCVEQMTVQY